MSCRAAPHLIALHQHQRCDPQGPHVTLWCSVRPAQRARRCLSRGQAWSSSVRHPLDLFKQSPDSLQSTLCHRAQVVGSAPLLPCTNGAGQAQIAEDIIECLEAGVPHLALALSSQACCQASCSCCKTSPRLLPPPGPQGWVDGLHPLPGPQCRCSAKPGECTNECKGISCTEHKQRSPQA